MTDTTETGRPTANDRLKAALEYAAKGFHVFPCQPEGKAPLTGNGYKAATTDPDIIKTWWAQHPNANIGMALAPSGLVALDVDSYKPDCEWPQFSADKDVPETLTQRSARGGTHLIFRAEPGAKYLGKPCKGVDGKHEGHILAEPSTFEGGVYKFQNKEPIAPAPDWLKRPERTAAEATGNPAGETGVSLAEVEDALSHISADCDYDRWLSVLMAIHSEFGDRGIVLADEWSQTAPHRYQDGAVENKFASFTAGQGCTIRTVFDLAKKGGADLAALAAKHRLDPLRFFEPAPGVSIFEEMSRSERADAGEATGAQDVSLFPLLRIKDLMARKPPVFLVDRHVPQNALGFVYGKPGAKKSFMMLDMALSIAHGFGDWHGEAITPTGDGSVIYIAAEGAFDLQVRIAAWLQARSVQLQEDRFFVLETAVDFMNAVDVEKLIRTVRAHSATPALVVVDTVSRAIPGADENLQKEMSLFVRACERLQHAFGCSVVGVHHAGRNGDLRGSTVLRGAADFVIRIESDAKQGKLVMDKQKSAPDGWSYPFRAEKHVLFGVEDARGAVQSSLVFERSGAADDAAREGVTQSVTPTEQSVLSIAERLAHGGSTITAKKISEAARAAGQQLSPEAARKHAGSLVGKGWLLAVQRGQWAVASLQEDNGSEGFVCHEKRNSALPSMSSAGDGFHGQSGTPSGIEIFG